MLIFNDNYTNVHFSSNCSSINSKSTENNVSFEIEMIICLQNLIHPNLGNSSAVSDYFYSK